MDWIEPFIPLVEKRVFFEISINSTVIRKWSNDNSKQHSSLDKLKLILNWKVNSKWFFSNEKSFETILVCHHQVHLCDYVILHSQWKESTLVALEIFMEKSISMIFSDSINIHFTLLISTEVKVNQSSWFLQDNQIDLELKEEKKWIIVLINWIKC